MKPGAKKAWRPVGWFFLATGAAVILALNSGWFSNSNSDSSLLHPWFSASAGSDALRPTPLMAAVEEAPRGARLSLSEPMDATLFARARNGWILNSSRVHFTSAWIAQQSGGVAASWSIPSPASDFVTAGFVAASSGQRGFAPPESNAPDGGPPPSGQTGFWIANDSGNWGTAANWQSGTIPTGPASTAHFDTLNITTDVTVIIETNRIVGDLTFGDTNGSHSYTIAPNGGTSLTFESGGANSVIAQAFNSAGDTISVPLFLKNDLLVTNYSPANPLAITGNIASSAASGTGQTLEFSGGPILVSGDITPGSTGADLGLQIGGNVNLSGTNTYGGSTFVTGQLFVKGDSSGATGPVLVAGGGSLLSGIGTVGGHVNILGGTITGGTTTEVGRLTLTQGLDIAATEGGGGIYLANLSGDTSDLLAITGALNLNSNTTLNIQGAADGTTTYTLATFGSITGMFGNVLGLPVGYDLVYHDTDLQLVPIPEPSTWIGGALALGVIGFMKRKRLRLKTLKGFARRSRVIG